MNKYSLNFDGSIGDFIRILRKSNKINSIELSKSIGKSESYISHLENGRYKNPDYEILYEIFKKLGVEEKKIEDYLYYFGFLSPERIAWEEEQAIAAMNEPTQEDFEEWERQAEYYENLEEEERLQWEMKERSNFKDENNGNDLLDDILAENIKNIEKVLNNIYEHNPQNGYELIEGLNDTFGSLSTNVKLYKFIIKFFSEKNIKTLDEKGFIKVLNTLYEELNRVDEENTAFGKPHLRHFIKNF
ncbi:helix-turn-helix domain-containing protein [Niallia sp. 01092]|uniref:helix-turn-helix domain-containing protein n=1 Tax=Niallia sp. 01092 TaxID=3457759 RepID=UPI003FD520E5